MTEFPYSQPAPDKGTGAETFACRCQVERRFFPAADQTAGDWDNGPSDQAPAVGETARSFAEWSSSWINAHGYPPAAHEVYAALAAQSQAGREPVPFADGENPCVLEWGAVSLPMGDPSRITEMKLCPTLWAAIAEGALCGFDWRVYPMALSPTRAAEGGANG